MVWPCKALKPCRGTLDEPVTNCRSLALRSSSNISTAFQNHFTTLLSVAQCFRRVFALQSWMSIFPRPHTISCRREKALQVSAHRNAVDVPFTAYSSESVCVCVWLVYSLPPALSRQRPWVGAVVWPHWSLSAEPETELRSRVGSASSHTAYRQETSTVEFEYKYRTCKVL